MDSGEICVTISDRICAAGGIFPITVWYNFEHAHFLIF